jgi:hypothetical protein
MSRLTVPLAIQRPRLAFAHDRYPVAVPRTRRRGRARCRVACEARSFNRTRAITVAVCVVARTADAAVSTRPSRRRKPVGVRGSAAAVARPSRAGRGHSASGRLTRRAYRRRRHATSPLSTPIVDRGGAIPPSEATPMPGGHPGASRSRPDALCAYGDRAATGPEARGLQGIRFARPGTSRA